MDPKYGIATKYEFLPTLAKLRYELNNTSAEDHERWLQERRRIEQLEERKFLTEPSEKIKYPDLESMRATYSPAMKSIVNGDKPENPYLTDPTKFKEQFLHKTGTTQADLDKIPDLKDYDWKKAVMHEKKEKLEKEANPFDDP